MAYLCGGLLVLMLVLATITLVGHGIWVFIAALFKPAQDAPPSKVDNDQIRPAGEEWALAAKQLRALKARGLLTQYRLEMMLDVLREQREEHRQAKLEQQLGVVTEPEPPPKPVRKPVVKPPIVRPKAEEAIEITEFVDPEPPQRPQPRKPAPKPQPTPKQPVAARPKPPAEPPAPPKPIVEPPAPPKPKRDLGSILQAFMEEKNIRWGELISGLLIVGSGIGLVISLWSTLQQAIPYFPALLFMLCTTAIHGAGLYTLRRWNLKSTSRGLLLISTLLIPLNFLAAIALSGQPGSPSYVPATSIVYFIAVGVGVLGYGAIAFSSGRVFRKPHWWILWSAVMVPSIGLLIIARQALPNMGTIRVNLLALPPVLGFGLAMAAQLSLSAMRRFSIRRANHTFQILGVGAFTVLMAFGLLLFKSDRALATLAQASPLFSIFAILITAGGLVVHLRATRETMAGHQTAGTAVSLTGSAMMLAGLALAWPQPDLLIAVGIVDAIALTALALAGRLPVLHIPAIAAVAMTSLISMHWSTGLISMESTGADLIDAFLTGQSGLLLLGLGIASALGAYQWKRNSHDGVAQSYLWSAAGLGVISLLVAFLVGFADKPDSHLATPIFAVAAVAALIACRRFKQPWAAWAGGVMLFVTFAHGLEVNEPVVEFMNDYGLALRNPLLIAGMLAASICAALGLEGFQRRREESLKDVNTQLCVVGFVFAAMCLPAMVFAHDGDHLLHAGYITWVLIIWGLSAVALRSRELAIATQSVSFIAVGFFATAIATALPWWEERFDDPRYWQLLLGSLAGWSALWSIARRAAKVDSLPAKLLAPREFNVDHIVLAATAIGAVMLAVIGVLPGIAHELTLLPRGDLPLFDGQPQDLWIAAGVVALAVGALVAAGIGLLRDEAGIVILAGLAAIAITGTLMTRVTAESYLSSVGVSHALAHGIGTWILLAIVVAGIVMTMREQMTALAIGALVVLGGLVPVLIAGGLENHLHTATALRFGLAGYGILLVLVDAFRFRIADVATRVGIRAPESIQETLLAATRGTSLAVTVWPILAITLYAALHVAGGNVIAGDLWPALFGRFDFGLTYAIPVWMLAGTLLAIAVARSNEGAALSASLLIQLGMTLLFALTHWIQHGGIGPVGLVELLQWSGIGLGACTLLWALWNRRLRAGESEQPGRAFDIQFAWTIATPALLTLWATFAIILAPTQLDAIIQQIGHPLGFIALGLATAAAMVAVRQPFQANATDVGLYAGLAVVPMLAAAASSLRDRLGIADPWLAYHVLIAGWATVAALATGLSLRKTLPERLVRLALGIAGGLVLLGIRAQLGGPHRPWWLFGTAAFAAVVWTVHAIAKNRTPLAYGSAGFTLLAVVAALPSPVDLYVLLNDGFALVLATFGIGLLWLSVEIVRQRRLDDADSPTTETPPVHHAAAVLGLFAVGLFSVIALAVRENAVGEIASQIPLLISPLGNGVLLAGIALLAGSLWERRALYAIPGLFVMGLAICLGVLDGINARVVFPKVELSLSELWLGLGFIASGYVAMTAGLWSQRQPLASIAKQLRIADEQIENSGTGLWLPWVDLGLAMFAALVGFWAVLSLDVTVQRFAAGIATLLLAPALALFAQNQRAEAFRFLSLLAIGVAGVQLAWAVPLPDELQNVALERTIRFLEVTAVATLVFASLPMGRSLQTTWGASIRQMSATTGFAAIIGLLLVLGQEASLFDKATGVAIADVQVGVVAGILVALIAGLIVLAVRSGDDPFQLSERGRMLYVYAAEAVGGLLFLHIYLCRPYWFGYLLPWWPYIVLGIAYAGVAVGEICRRMKLDVIAEPLQRTATFLPLLPAIAFWVNTPGGPLNEYSLLLFLIGLMYVGLAMFRQSLWYSLAAAVAGNLALWSLYGYYGSSLLTRPQVWLIPPALSLLAAAQINRKRLSEAQLTAIRYFSVLTIYAASTAELFIYGAKDPRNFWHPIVLASLSIAGILSGMLMRIRAFLYLGTTFLLLSLTSMVWHAARAIDEVWPWWVFGIVTGAALLAMFGVFEKKRDEVLGSLRRLKEWEG